MGSPATTKPLELVQPLEAIELMPSAVPTQWRDAAALAARGSDVVAIASVAFLLSLVVILSALLIRARRRHARDLVNLRAPDGHSASPDLPAGAPPGRTAAVEFGDRLARRVMAEYYAKLYVSLEQGLAERGYKLLDAGEGDANTAFPSLRDMMQIGRTVERARMKELRPFLSDSEIELKVDYDKEDGYSHAFATCLLSAALLEGRRLARTGYPALYDQEASIDNAATRASLEEMFKASGIDLGDPKIH